jgi:hypothetical protein
VATYLFGIGILVMRTVSAEVVARSDLPAVLHVIGQPQPPLCHVRENQLGVRVIEYLSQLEAGLGPCSVRVTTVHERCQIFDCDNSPPPKCQMPLMVPDFVMERVPQPGNSDQIASFFSIKQISASGGAYARLGVPSLC